MNKKTFKPAPSRGLTNKQEAFCHYVIIENTITGAYRRAYNCENMLPTTVNRKAVELHDKGMIAARIEEIREMYIHEYDVELKGMMRRLGKIAFADPADTLRKAYTEGIDALTFDEVKMVKSVKDTKYGVDIVMKDTEKTALVAIDKLVRMLGGYEKDNIQKNNNDVPQLGLDESLKIIKSLM